MKKRRALSLVFVCAMLTGHHAGAYDEPKSKRQQGAPAVLADLMLLRPFGIAITAAGTGLFVATLPFTVIAGIAPPHDALEKAGTALVVAPAAFTFWRPIGDFTYQPCGVYSGRPEPCAPASQRRW